MTKNLGFILLKTSETKILKQVNIQVTKIFLKIFFRGVWWVA